MLTLPLHHYGMAGRKPGERRSDSRDRVKKNFCQNVWHLIIPYSPHKN